MRSAPPAIASSRPPSPRGRPLGGLPTLGRALLRLAVAEACGRLVVRGPAPARIAVAGGRLLHVESAGLSLGGYVARAAPRALAPALRGARRRPGRAGDALLAAGIPAWLVTRALHAQHRSRLRAVLSATPRALHFDAVAAPEPTRGTLDLVDAVLDAARNAPAPSGLEPAHLMLTPLGRRALPGRALTPRECALRDLLLRAPDGASDVLLAASLGPAATALSARWRALGLLQAPRRGSAALLLRTRLELSRGEIAAPRRSLRRLAGSLHPDRFDAALSTASTAVTRGLLAAARHAS